MVDAQRALHHDQSSGTKRFKREMLVVMGIECEIDEAPNVIGYNVYETLISTIQYTLYWMTASIKQWSDMQNLHNSALVKYLLLIFSHELRLMPAHSAEMHRCRS